MGWWSRTKKNARRGWQRTTEVLGDVAIEGGMMFATATCELPVWSSGCEVADIEKRQDQIRAYKREQDIKQRRRLEIELKYGKGYSCLPNESSACREKEARKGRCACCRRGHIAINVGNEGRPRSDWRATCVPENHLTDAQVESILVRDHLSGNRRKVRGHAGRVSPNVQMDPPAWLRTAASRDYRGAAAAKVARRERAAADAFSALTTGLNNTDGGEAQSAQVALEDL
jgi:hypothetical protein